MIRPARAHDDLTIPGMGSERLSVARQQQHRDGRAPRVLRRQYRDGGTTTAEHARDTALPTAARLRTHFEIVHSGSAGRARWQPVVACAVAE